MIEAKKIGFSYPQGFSLSNVSLRIEPGRILGLIGHSGSGKSTLLRILAGVLEASVGQVLIQGRPITPPSQKLIRGLAEVKMVTQHNTLFPNISVFENIAYTLRYFEKSFQQSRIKKLLTLLGISHLSDKLPRELSGGEVQRVSIAVAIADEPKVLLLDEPFSNLDAIVKKKVMMELRRVMEVEKMACLLVTHEIMDAFGLVDKLLILKQGKVAQSGTSAELYQHPKNRYVAQLVGDVFFVDGGSWGHNGTLGFRPEAVQLNPAGELSVEVVQAVFRGYFYEIYFNLGGSLCFFRHPLAFANGQVLRLTISPRFII
jgi:ABC-type sugar transport system ATPase subunit